MKIIKEENNPLLSRRRIYCEIDSKITPSKEEAKKILAEKLKAKEDLLIIKHVYPVLGTNRARVIAHIYESAERLKSIEKVKKPKKKDAKETEAKE